jgi:hypothetical protein
MLGALSQQRVSIAARSARCGSSGGCGDGAAAAGAAAARAARSLPRPQRPRPPPAAAAFPRSPAAATARRRATRCYAVDQMQQFSKFASAAYLDKAALRFRVGERCALAVVAGVGAVMWLVLVSVCS